MRRIGRYEVEREIGRGAMGVVYLAHDARLQRPVALKTIALPDGLDPAHREEYRERFLREARAAAGLSHPRIVTVFDADTDEGGEQPFIAMEYVEGPTLRELLEERGKLDPEHAFEIVRGVAEALEAAHAAGIVHRDVKPANLIVRRSDGRVKVTDFGVARVGTSELTRSGTTLGSPAYMSPEQVRGRAVDGRSDLFSLAVILYEALCGSRPFDGEDTPALAYAIAHETPVPLTRRDPELPAGLERFLDRALAKSADERFADATEFRDALERARHARIDTEATAVVTPSVSPEAVPAAVGVVAEPSLTPLDSMPVHEPRRWLRRSHVAALLFLVTTLAGWILVGGTEESYLQLDAKSTVTSGELTLLVDGKRVYRRELSAPEQKKGLLQKVLTPKPETFEAWIEIEPGKHEIVALVVREDEDDGYRDTVVVDLEPGQTRTLKLNAGRTFGSSLSLKVN